MNNYSESLRLSDLAKSPAGQLAAALIGLEFLAGIQSFSNQVIRPLVASEFHAQALYGWMTVSASLPALFALAVSGALYQRLDPGRMMRLFTILLCVGALMSAIGPGLISFIAGRVIQSAASGALGGFGLAIAATLLPEQWRRWVFSANAAMWVVSSLSGPAYAASVSAVLGWRGVLIIPLPLIFVCRFIIAGNISKMPLPASRPAPIPAVAATILVVFIALIPLSELFPTVRWALQILGVAGALFVATRLLPRGSLLFRGRRPGAIGLMFVVTGIYFGAESAVAIVAYDVLNFGPLSIGLLFLSGGLAWALTSLVVAKLSSADSYVKTRLHLACLALAGGLFLMCAAFCFENGILLGIGWSLSSLGIGLGYVDIMNLGMTEPVPTDGIPNGVAAAAVGLAEMIAVTIPSAVITTFLGAAIAYGSGRYAAILIFASVAVMSLAAVFIPPRIFKSGLAS